MEQKSNTVRKTGRKRTRWDGLFVSEHAWDFHHDPQPMLTANEQGAVIDMLIVACERKCPVFIQSWQDRHFHYHHCTISKLDHRQWTITYKDSFGERQLAIRMITSVYMLD